MFEDQGHNAAARKMDQLINDRRALVEAIERHKEDKDDSKLYEVLDRVNA